MTYNLFISHSWTYSDAYDKLVNLLDDAENFSYRNTLLLLSLFTAINCCYLNSLSSS